MYLAGYETDNHIDIYILVTLIMVLLCMMVLVYQSFREPVPIEYLVPVEPTAAGIQACADALADEGGYIFLPPGEYKFGDPNKTNNIVNLYGHTEIFVRSEFDMPLDEDGEY